MRGCSSKELLADDRPIKTSVWSISLNKIENNSGSKSG